MPPWLTTPPTRFSVADVLILLAIFVLIYGAARLRPRGPFS
jgi:hypothetical protein